MKKCFKRLMFAALIAILFAAGVHAQGNGYHETISVKVGEKESFEEAPDPDLNDKITVKPNDGRDIKITETDVSDDLTQVPAWLKITSTTTVVVWKRSGVGALYEIEGEYIEDGDEDGDEENGPPPVWSAEVEDTPVDGSLALYDLVEDDPNVGVVNSGNGAPIMYCKTNGDDNGHVGFKLLLKKKEGIYAWNISSDGGGVYQGQLRETGDYKDSQSGIDPGAYTLTVTGDDDFERKIDFVVVSVKVTQYWTKVPVNATEEWIAAEELRYWVKVEHGGTLDSGEVCERIKFEVVDGDGGDAKGKFRSPYGSDELIGGQLLLSERGEYTINIKWKCLSDDEWVKLPAGEDGENIQVLAVGGEITFPLQSSHRPIVGENEDGDYAVLPVKLDDEASPTAKGKAVVVNGDGTEEIRFEDGIDFGEFVDVSVSDDGKININPSGEGYGDPRREKWNGTYSIMAEGMEFVDGEWKSIEKRKDGYVEPLTLISPDLGIATPDGDPTDPSKANQYNERVFDQNGEGECTVICKATPMGNLSETARNTVLDHLNWTIDAAGGVDAVEEEVPDEPIKTVLRYESMPETYDDFGAKTLTMKLGPDSSGWSWTQNVEVFFHADGTSGPVYQGNGQGFDAKAETFEYYGQYETSDDKPDNATPTAPIPNKINYWRELAADAAGEEPQEEMGSTPPSLSDAVGYYHVSIHGTDMTDTVQIFAGADANAYAFIHVLHHENGHFARWHAPAAQGGWGAAFQYDPSKDGPPNKRDQVHKDFEQTQTAKNYKSGFDFKEDNSSLRGEWDHETDPTGAQKNLGAGRCREYEEKVRYRDEFIKNNDWSDVGPNHDH